MTDIPVSELAVFRTAFGIESDELREAYLHQVCGEDPRMYNRVVELLQASEEDPEFLESPPTGVGPTIDCLLIAERPGTVIDRYKLLEQIGEGGMGIVFMAQQLEPVKRKVALKIIKPGMDTKQVIARFAAEQQALALMDHPNIAQVLDAGITGGKGERPALCEAPEGPSRQSGPFPLSAGAGRPYFVMELVKGIPITEYCDRNSLTPRERLELFVPVCQAVQHAHQKGIIHRDIKPTNVLVTLHDGTPVVKVIDFGVAKAIDQELTERTLFTHFAQMVGTPLYMSPEQAELSGLDVDTRTDVYSLGVLLYELLTGVTPFDRQRLHEAAFDEMRRIIREEEPPKPSARISTLGETLSSVSEHRKTEPKRLTAQVRGDLDWIAMKALDKDRSRRYDTAKDFAADVSRYLQNEAIQARPPSRWYRLRKYVRRHRVAVTTTSLVILALVIGASATIWQSVRVARLQTARTGDALNRAFRAEIAAGELSDAERSLDELRELGLARDPETLRSQGELAWALAGEDRLEDAAELLLQTWKTQCEVLGEEHADARKTVATRKDLAFRCGERAWLLLTQRPNAPRADYELAVRLARLAVELIPSWGNLRSILGLAEYRCGKWKAARDTFAETLLLHKPWVAPWLGLSMVHQELGDEALARDWYTAARDWMTMQQETGPYRRYLQNEAAPLLGIPPEWPPPEWTSADYVDLYSRLIGEYPRVAMLHHRRGTHYARLRRWKEAASDYAKATELRPDEWQFWEAWIPACLQAHETRAYQAACSQVLDRFRSHDDPLPRARSIVLCCLRPFDSVDAVDLQNAAEALPPGIGQATVTQLARGMVAYRCGRYQEALDVLPKGTFRYPPNDWMLVFLFRAMAHHRLGQADQARELLEAAQERVFPLEGLPLIKLEDRTVTWCTVQPALREAEDLIEPAGTEAPAAQAGVEEKSAQSQPGG